MTVETQTQIEDAIAQILDAVGEDPKREGLIKTPQRVASMYLELLEGYHQTVREVVGDALFEAPQQSSAHHLEEFVSVCHIPYSSLCEHHMLPFTGVAHIAYVPHTKIIGLSKIPRIVDLFSKRLQVQERLTHEVAYALYTTLESQAVMVIMEGAHTCASLRGVKKHNVNMITRALYGDFTHSLQDAFLKQISWGKSKR